jgi:hypothetical protein
MKVLDRKSPVSFLNLHAMNGQIKNPWPLNSLSQIAQMRVRIVCRLFAPLFLLALFFLAALGLVTGPLFLLVYRPDAPLSRFIVQFAHSVGRDAFTVIHAIAVIAPLALIFWVFWLQCMTFVLEARTDESG